MSNLFSMLAFQVLSRDTGPYKFYYSPFCNYQLFRVKNRVNPAGAMQLVYVMC